MNDRSPTAVHGALPMVTNLSVGAFVANLPLPGPATRNNGAGTCSPPLGYCTCRRRYIFFGLPHQNVFGPAMQRPAQLL